MGSTASSTRYSGRYLLPQLLQDHPHDAAHFQSVSSRSDIESILMRAQGTYWTVTPSAFHAAPIASVRLGRYKSPRKTHLAVRLRLFELFVSTFNAKLYHQQPSDTVSIMIIEYKVLWPVSAKQYLHASRVPRTCVYGTVR